MEHITNKDFAIKTAIELAKINLENSQTFVDGNAVTQFIDGVYNFLVGETKGIKEE